MKPKFIICITLLCVLLLVGCAAKTSAPAAEHPQRDTALQAAEPESKPEPDTAQVPESAPDTAQTQDAEPENQAEDAACVYMLYQDVPGEKGLLLTDSQLCSRPEQDAVLETGEPLQAGTCVELLSAVQLLPTDFQDWSDGEVWYFVRLLAVRDVPSSTVGFLPASDVTAYTADTAAGCTAPLYLKPGAACTVDGVQTVWTEDDPQMPLWLIGQDEQQGLYRLAGAAGVEVLVSSLDALEYPLP